MEGSMEFGQEQRFGQPRVWQGRRKGSGHTGALPSPERKYEIKHLWERHHKMLRLTLIGWDPRDIATELGVTVATVMNCVNSSLGRKLLSEMQAAVDNKAVDVATRLQLMSQKATDALEEILDDPDTPKSLRARIAMDNLDRTGHARQINVKGQFTHGILTADDIAKLKENAYAGASVASIPDSTTIDADFVETDGH